MAAFAELTEFKKKFEENPQSAFSESFTSLVAAQLTVPPWIASDFWLNVRTQAFADQYMLVLLQFLEKDLKPVERRRTVIEKAGNPALQRSAILAALHLTVTYRRPFPPDVWQSQIDSIFETSPDNPVFTVLREYLHSPPFLVQDVVQPVITEYSEKILADAMPLFGLVSLMRLVRSDSVALYTTYKAFELIAVWQKTRESVFMLVHLLKIVMSAFPGLEAGQLLALKNRLLENLSMIEPISSMVAQTAQQIENELSYCGMSYYETLKNVLEFSPAMGGVVPMLFDQSYRLLPNFLYSNTVVVDSLQVSVVKWVRYFVRTHFRCSKELSLEDCLEFFEKITFRKKNEATLIEKYGLKADIEGEIEMAGQLVPPVVPLLPIKFPVNMDLDVSMLEPFIGNEQFFRVPSKAVFTVSIMEPITNYIQQNKDVAMIDQRIVLAGNDFFISTALMALMSASVQKPEIQEVTSFTFFILPLSLEREGSIAKYIASRDKVYSYFVHMLYDITSSIAPTFDESSQVAFKALPEDKTEYETHPWFSDPSPMNVFRFGVQHFLLFARNYVDIFIWKVVLVLDTPEKPSVVVPLIGSLHIGNLLCNATTGTFTTDITKARSFNITTTDCHDVVQDTACHKITSIALWNCDEDTGMRPTDGWLLMEKTTSSNPVRRQEELPNLYRELVHGVVIEEAQKQPFIAMIDQRTYKSILKMTVTYMPDLNDSGEWMKMRLATFGLVQ